MDAGSKRGAAPRGMRPGFTIVEILLAMLLLTFVVMGFQAATGQIIHFAAQADRQSVASQLVEDRLELIRMDPVYNGLEGRWEATESSLVGYDGLSRTTAVTRYVDTLNTGIVDYYRITVTVAGTGLPAPLARTVSIAAP